MIEPQIYSVGEPSSLASMEASMIRTRLMRREHQMTAPVVKPYQRHRVKTPIRTVSSAAAVIRDDKTEWENR